MPRKSGLQLTRVVQSAEGLKYSTISAVAKTSSNVVIPLRTFTFVYLI